MAPRPTKRTPAPTRPDPLRKLAELAGRAVSPERMYREVEAMVAGLLSGAGEADRIEVREQLGEMADQLAEGVDAAVEATADLDSADRVSMRQAEAGLAALRAAHAALAATRQRV